jgi:talin
MIVSGRVENVGNLNVNKTTSSAVDTDFFFSTTNITEMSKDIRMLAALQESDDDSDRLLGAAKRLVDAFSTMLKAAQPDSKESRQNLLSSASKVSKYFYFKTTL